MNSSSAMNSGARFVGSVLSTDWQSFHNQTLQSLFIQKICQVKPFANQDYTAVVGHSVPVSSAAYFSPSPEKLPSGAERNSRKLSHDAWTDNQIYKPCTSDRW